MRGNDQLTPALRQYGRRPLQRAAHGAVALIVAAYGGALAAPASGSAAPGSAAPFKVIATVNVGVNPFGEAVAPDGRTVWIANAGPSTVHVGEQGHTVTVLDERTLAIDSVINVGVFPEEIAFAHDGRRAFVTNSTDGTVSVISTARRAVQQTVSLSGIPMTFPFGISATHKGKVFVTSVGGASPKSIAVLCAKNRGPVSICGTIVAPAFTGGTALTPHDRLLVVTRGQTEDGPPEVTLIDPVTNQITGDLSLNRPGAAQTVAVSPDGKFAYAAIFGGTGGIWVINLATRATVTTIPTPDTGMIGIQVSPDGRFVAATDFLLGEVSVISTATDRIVANIPVGPQPNGVVFSADGCRAFVANEGATTVSVISFPCRSQHRPRQRG